VRVLIVAFPHSIHTMRGAELASQAGLDVHLFPSLPLAPHPDLHDLTVYVDPGIEIDDVDESVRVERLDGRRGPRTLEWDERCQGLVETIRQVEPDLIHTMEIQSAGYLTLAARQELGEDMPPWLVHNWGSDIYHYGRIRRHVPRIKAVLSACDYYWSECHRDVGLARAFGLRGRALPVMPVTGGYDLERAAALRAPGPPSSRRTIALKAAEQFVYRPERAVDALEQCADLLAGHRVALYMASPSIRARVARVCEGSGAELEVVSELDRSVRHDEILAMHGRARASIALSSSDAICTSFLDALVMGSFPIQSNTSCAHEWARHGEGAWFADPNDVETLAAGLRRALTDDPLVDAAADVNARTASRHLDRRVVGAMWADTYERMVADSAGLAAAA
jgi:glycosyltransferase involved in cell wall biosynthesis